MNVPASAALKIQLMKSENVSAETVLHQVLHSPALQMVDNGALPGQSISTYLTLILSNPIVLRNEESHSMEMSLIEQFPVSRIQHNKAAYLFDELKRVFPFRVSLASDAEPLYVLKPASCSLNICHYILHKQLHNNSTIYSATRSNIGFMANAAFFRTDSTLKPLLQDLTSSLEQLTDTGRFQTVSSVLFECTEFPLVLIELVLQYCFCIQLR